MKRRNILLLATAICFGLFISGCKKSAESTPQSNDQQQHNQDVANTKTESDNLNQDINTAISPTAIGKTGSVNSFTICGGTVNTDSLSATQPYVIITYDGSVSCGIPARTRSGQVKVQLISGTAWHNQNAVLEVTHTNYKVTYTANNHTLLFNGHKFLTDLNGINWLTWLGGGDTLALKEYCDDMTVQFENGKTASWNWSRVSKYWVNPLNSAIYASVNGDSINGNQTIDSWGQTRWGTNFTTYMIQPWQANSSCGWWMPTSGQYSSSTANFTIGVTFGTNATGGPATTACPSYFDLTWTINSPSSNGSIVLPYW